MNILFATWHLGGKNPCENRGIVVNQYQPEQAGLSKVQQSVFCSAFFSCAKRISIKFHHGNLGGGNSNIFYFHPEPWGNDPIWRAYFSTGLKPPSWESKGPHFPKKCHDSGSRENRQVFIYKGTMRHIIVPLTIRQAFFPGEFPWYFSRGPGPVDSPWNPLAAPRPLDWNEVFSFLAPPVFVTMWPSPDDQLICFVPFKWQETHL